jgi:hypothetical protein
MALLRGEERPTPVREALPLHTPLDEHLLGLGDHILLAVGQGRSTG